MSLRSILAKPSDFELNRQANLETVCATFLEARKQWEMSEAFLFGAATVCGIDPHIDSWPLDEDGYKSLMASPSMLSNLKGEGGAAWAGDNLGNGLLGFHGMEYILFSASAEYVGANVLFMKFSAMVLNA